MTRVDGIGDDSDKYPNWISKSDDIADLVADSSSKFFF